MAFMQPDLFVFLRMFISGILLIAIYCRHKRLFYEFCKNYKILFVIAVFTTFLPSLLRAYALQYISSTRAAFWGSFEPFLTALYLYILFGKKLTKNQLLGCLIGFAGALVFIFFKDTGSFNGYYLLCFADIAQILSIVLSRFGWIQAQEILKKNIFTPQQMNGMTFTISGLLALCMFFIRSRSTVSFSLLSLSSFSSSHYLLLWTMLYTITIGNMLAYTLYAKALKKYSATVVALGGLTVPLFVHILGLLFLKEQFSYSFISAFACICLGLWVFHKDSKTD